MTKSAKCRRLHVKKVGGQAYADGRQLSADAWWPSTIVPSGMRVEPPSYRRTVECSDRPRYVDDGPPGSHAILAVAVFSYFESAVGVASAAAAMRGVSDGRCER
jgi:hypothetical protein